MVDSPQHAWGLVVTSRAEGRVSSEEPSLGSVVSYVEENLPGDRIIVACSLLEVAELARTMPGIPEQNFLVPPAPRGSAALAVLATGLVRQMDPSAWIVSIPQSVPKGDLGCWLKDSFCVPDMTRENAVFIIVGSAQLNRQGGIRPYGRVKHARFPIDASMPNLYPVTGTSNADIEEGKAGGAENGEPTLANTGIVSWRASMLIDRLADTRPDLAEIVRATGDEWQHYDYERIMAMQWSRLPESTEAFWDTLVAPLATESLVLSSV